MGFVSTPTVVSWGKDGTKDLIVGTVSQRGLFRYFENIGGNGTPLFKEGVRLKSGGLFIRGSRACPIDWNGDGVDDLLVLTYRYYQDSDRWQNGSIRLYEKLGGSRFPELAEVGMHLTQAPL